MAEMVGFKRESLEIPCWQVSQALPLSKRDSELVAAVLVAVGAGRFCPTEWPVLGDLSAGPLRVWRSRKSRFRFR